ncbi:DUF4157 domain-containing protein [Phormidium tenue]|uniref:eCIS core domain-containing protein n=1 Tax=Phormidium tenue NIES-30 TaxID=549789 RepID=A0A1U7IY48_9CYAN|nr:DUF4157 domain-containing protein [Phormidium tenue]MBD2233311.1 DUF4157 domain-containing protein [Phormidium tenue FACHB-1052]OKH43261.1 hypothetical protein NIES30_25240 [Phormidium tenue NIES-30]
MGNQRLTQAQALAQKVEAKPVRAINSKPKEDGLEPLQGLVSNRAVNQMLTGEGADAQPYSSLRSQKSSFRGLSSEITGGSQPQGLVIQPKLVIGQPNDKYEQEADRVAEQVVQQLNAPKTVESNAAQIIQREVMPDEDEDKLQMKPMVQPQGEVGEVAATPELESSIQQMRGGGQPLPDSIREPMERIFRADFSQVRVHTDNYSDKLNSSIAAKAFTTKQDIFFKRNAYSPASNQGLSTIAHELTHVIQQQGKSLGRAKRGLYEKSGSTMIQRTQVYSFDDTDYATTTRVDSGGSSKITSVMADWDLPTPHYILSKHFGNNYELKNKPLKVSEEKVTRPRHIKAEVHKGTTEWPNREDPKFVTRIGHFGQDELFLSSSGTKVDYAGGHLVGYAILGDAAQIPENIAPQQAYNNSVEYQNTMEQAIRTSAPGSVINYEIEVDYGDINYELDQQQLVELKLIGKIDPSKPWIIQIPRRVPRAWNASAEIRSGTFGSITAIVDGETYLRGQYSTFLATPDLRDYEPDSVRSSSYKFRAYTSSSTNEKDTKKAAKLRYEMKQFQPPIAPKYNKPDNVSDEKTRYGSMTTLTTERAIGIGKGLTNRLQYMSTIDCSVNEEIYRNSWEKLKKTAEDEDSKNLKLEPNRRPKNSYQEAKKNASKALSEARKWNIEHAGFKELWAKSYGEMTEDIIKLAQAVDAAARKGESQIGAEDKTLVEELIRRVTEWEVEWRLQTTQQEVVAAMYIDPSQVRNSRNLKPPPKLTPRQLESNVRKRTKAERKEAELVKNK